MTLTNAFRRIGYQNRQLMYNNRPVSMSSIRLSDHVHVTIRAAVPADEAALRRLAQLDSAAPPQGPVVVAEVDGGLLAAISLADGRTVADPFAPTAELVAMLQVRAAQLAAPAHGARRWRRRRRVLARAA
jgi:hypothetical protein